MCDRNLGREFFSSISTQSSSALGSARSTATMSSEDFVVISVEGEGLEAGQRVLELTSPLALAGMCVKPRNVQWREALLIAA